MVSHAPARPPCIWDDTEAFIKASVMARDASLAQLWISAYLENMVCFPRLNVVADNVSLVPQRFSKIPNVTFHTVQYLPNVPQDFLQWAMMWADNFTSPAARHVMIFDTDTPPLVPVRCHHLFDESERPRWYAWNWGPRTPKWVHVVNTLFDRAGGPTVRSVTEPLNDFMTFFPVVVPRFLFAAARHVAARAYHTHFDEAWHSIPFSDRSYGDLLGKTAVVLHPSSVHAEECPPVGRMKELIAPTVLAAAEEAARVRHEGECFHHVFPVEHVRHPQRDAHTGHCHHHSRSSALFYTRSLRKRATAFAHGAGPLPFEMFHYQTNRSSEALQSIAQRVLRPDPPGRRCGALRGA